MLLEDVKGDIKGYFMRMDKKTVSQSCQFFPSWSEKSMLFSLRVQQDFFFFVAFYANTKFYGRVKG